MIDLSSFIPIRGRRGKKLSALDARRAFHACARAESGIREYIGYESRERARARSAGPNGRGAGVGRNILELRINNAINSGATRGNVARNAAAAAGEASLLLLHSVCAGSWASSFYLWLFRECWRERCIGDREFKYVFRHVVFLISCIEMGMIV